MVVIARFNIFNIPQAHNYHCYVERYQSNLHVLRIHARRFSKDYLPTWNHLEFVFTSVLYYEGLFDWDGAKICLAEQDECLSLFYKTGMFNERTDPEEVEENMEEYGLFVVSSPINSQICFIASLHAYTMNVIE